MKYFSLIFGWVTGCALAIFCSSASVIKADPADDFSFTLAPTPTSEVYHLVSERRVADILRDRLDLFPNSQVPKLARPITALCRKCRFDPVFTLSLIEVESASRVKAFSP